MAEEEWSIEVTPEEEGGEAAPQSPKPKEKELPYEWELGQIIANLESISESFEMIARHYISTTQQSHEVESKVEKLEGLV